jgi:membrane complex biogenesis BtpA family protein
VRCRGARSRAQRRLKGEDVTNQAAVRPEKILVGMVHLPALPGSPGCSMSMHDIETAALGEARILAEAGFDAVVVENFGDVPFRGECVEPVTVAAMTRIVCSLRRELPALRLGVNVLRNDARAALSIATAAQAAFVRINVHVGAAATDQGILQGHADESLRLRRELGADVAIWADVHVKHGRSLAHESVADEARDAVERGLADAIIVTGRGTGWSTDIDEIRSVRALQLGVPLLVGSGVTAQSLDLYLRESDGVIVGSALKAGGKAQGLLDEEKARRFVTAARALMA